MNRSLKEIAAQKSEDVLSDFQADTQKGLQQTEVDERLL